jgi:hypothetical protein
MEGFHFAESFQLMDKDMVMSGRHVGDVFAGKLGTYKPDEQIRVFFRPAPVPDVRKFAAFTGKHEGFYLRKTSGLGGDGSSVEMIFAGEPVCAGKLISVQAYAGGNVNTSVRAFQPDLYLQKACFPRIVDGFLSVEYVSYHCIVHSELFFSYLPKCKDRKKYKKNRKRYEFV